MALLRRKERAEASSCGVGCCVVVELEFEDPAVAERSVKDVIWPSGMMRYAPGGAVRAAGVMALVVAVGPVLRMRSDVRGSAV
jgi:hypothetical protein